MGAGASATEDDFELHNLTLNPGGEKEKFTLRECRYANGDVYQGRWRFDQKHGKGKYIFAATSEDGILYDGDWKHNAKHGKGTFYFKNGDGEFALWSLSSAHL